MKIEIGESLALSYLKHVKKCVLYQNNWKISSKWAKPDEEENKNKDDKTVEGKVFEEIKIIFKDIFKSDTLKQTLKQAEIDALGIDKEGKVYAVDVAFHEGNLNYKGGTANCVKKKLLRSYLILLRYFPDRDYDIIFASPKVGPTVNSDICNTLKFNQSKADNKEINKSELNDFEKLKRFLNDNIEFKNKVRFIYISNEEFKKGFLYNTIEASESDSDTNELFMRSYKLFQLFNKVPNSKAKKTESDTEVPPTASLVLEFNPSDENSIQAITDKS
jgi:hypothetical protein